MSSKGTIPDAPVSKTFFSVAGYSVEELGQIASASLREIVVSLAA
jgi:hypothetical protein